MTPFDVDQLQGKGWQTAWHGSRFEALAATLYTGQLQPNSHSDSHSCWAYDDITWVDLLLDSQMCGLMFLVFVKGDTYEQSRA